jgi:hypothetical protein
VKKGIIYVMLLFYVAIQLKPLTIIIQDVLAHTFWKMHHLATEHYQHGHHHVHATLAEDSVHEHTTPTEKQSSQKANEETSIHLLHTFNFIFCNRSINTHQKSNVQHNVLFVFIEINSPPPKA